MIVKKTRKISVLKIFKVSLNMLRITFTGNDLLDFPENENGGYVKFLFKSKNSKTSLVRPYTIRDFRKKKLELDIDFALHGNNKGYASAWAMRAKVGEEIFISGPGPKSILNPNSNWFIFIGDMSSLPAVSAHLEKLPSKSRGYAIIEILSKEDKQILKKPKNFKVHWLVNKDPAKNSSKLFEMVKLFEGLDENPFIWVACEFNTMKKLRFFFQNKPKIRKENIYISSYWKSGLNQEAHKIIKKNDSLKWSETG